METLWTLMILIPLLVTWSVFITSKNNMSSLVCLLASSVILPLVFMENLKMFWPCGILLILMSTGLIVIFAYIVSLSSVETKNYPRASWIILSTLVIVMMFTNSPSTNKVFHSELGVSVSISLSLLLIFLLLFLVVSFIRNVYSKGGGFRKKY